MPTNKITIGTHNSMSYLKPKKWYHWFFKPIYACQNKNIGEQLGTKITVDGVTYNIECFDFRIRFDEEAVPYFAHGIVGFKGADFDNIIKKINDYGKENGRIYFIRFILEDITYFTGIMSFLGFGLKCKNKEYLENEKERQTNLFYDLCNNIADKFSNILFFGGNRKGDWAQIYDFTMIEYGENNEYSEKVMNDIELHQFINSWPDETAEQPKRLEKIIPKLYAKRHNPDKHNCNKPLPEVSIYDFL